MISKTEADWAFNTISMLNLKKEGGGVKENSWGAQARGYRDVGSLFWECLSAPCDPRSIEQDLPSSSVFFDPDRWQPINILRGSQKDLTF